MAWLKKTSLANLKALMINATLIILGGLLVL